jgi:PDZ domain
VHARRIIHGQTIDDRLVPRIPSRLLKPGCAGHRDKRRIPRNCSSSADRTTIYCLIGRPLARPDNHRGREFMARSSIRAAAVAAALLAFAGPSLLAGPNRGSSIERFGIVGYIQPIGLHHGFHIDRVAPGSAAEKDNLEPHDIIVKVDGEVIRSVDHLRAALAEAFADDGEVTITYIRGGSLIHHDINCNVKKAPAKTAHKRKADPDLEIR